MSRISCDIQTIVTDDIMAGFAQAKPGDVDFVWSRARPYFAFGFTNDATTNQRIRRSVGVCCLTAALGGEPCS